MTRTSARWACSTFILLLQIGLVSTETCQSNIEDLFYNVDFTGPIFDRSVYLVNSNFSVDCKPRTEVFQFTVRPRTASDRPSYLANNFTGRSVAEDNRISNVSSSDGSFVVEIVSADNGTYVLKTAACPLNYTRLFHRHQFTLIATQSNGNRASTVSTALVQIDLTNANIHPPIFADRARDFYVSETAPPGTQFATVYATDADNDTITFATDSPLFSIDPVTGVLRLEKTLLHLAVPDTVSITVTIKDSCCSTSRPPCEEHTSTAEFKIHIVAVNKNAPRFVGDLCQNTISFKESVLSGETIATWLVMDGDRGENGQISVSFPSKALRNAASDYTSTAYSSFFIEQSPQVNSTRRVSLRTNRTFDYDEPGAIRMWSLTVVATDKGRPARSAFCSLHIRLLDVNDNRPRFVTTTLNSTIYPFSSQGINWSLPRLIAFDPDSGVNGLVYYYIGTLNVPYFAIDRTKGYVTIRSDVSPASFNASRFPVTFDVYAEDRGTVRLLSENNATVTIHFDGSNMPAPATWLSPTAEEFVVPIREKLYEASGGGIVKNESAGFNGTLMYQLPNNALSIIAVENPFLDSARSPFRGTQVTKENSVLKTSIEVYSGLHAEIQDTYLLCLRILVDPPLMKMMTIQVNDENDQSPTFDIRSMALSVMESEEGSRNLAHVRAFDRDAWPEHNEVIYELNRELSDSKAAQAFVVSTTGKIDTNVTFGREQWNDSSYRFFVTACNRKPAWDEKITLKEDIQIDVQVISSSRHAPEFVRNTCLDSINVTEPIVNGSVICKLNVTHSDTDTRLNFGIRAGNVGNAFVLVPLADNTGDEQRTQYQAEAALKIVIPIAYKAASRYTLELFASDGTNTVPINVTVHLFNQSNSAPYFKLMPGDNTYQYTVREGEAQKLDGSLIMASDPDGAAETVQYEIYNPNHQIDLQNVRLSPDGNAKRIEIVSPGLSRDRPFGSPVYNFAIKATNRGVSSYAPVRITVIDINNQAPIPINPSSWFIDEGNDSSTAIQFDDYDDPKENHTLPFTVKVLAPPNAKVTPTLSDDGLFTLTYSGALNFTTTKHFNVTFRASDVQNFSAETTISIQVRCNANNAYPISDGQKTIRVVYVDGFQNSIRNASLGSVYVSSSYNCANEPRDYLVTNVSNGQRFSTNTSWLSTPDVLMPGRLTVHVNVAKANSPSATSRITVETESMTLEAIREASTIRIQGEYPHTLIDPSLGNSFARLCDALATILKVPKYSVRILTIRPVFQYRSSLLPPKPLEVQKAEALTDVIFYVFNRDKLDVEQTLDRQLAQFASKFQINARASGPNPCAGYTCPQDTICRPSRTIGPRPALVDADRMSFVGVNIRDSADCVNASHAPNQRCQLTVFDSSKITRVSSPYGPVGPCGEVLGRTFDNSGQGYAVFAGGTFSNLPPSRLAFDFLLQSPIADGLILLYGRNTTAFNDFLWMAVEVYQSTVRFQFQGGPPVVAEINLTASTWHHVEYQFLQSEVLFSIDGCQHRRPIDRATLSDDLTDVQLYLGSAPSQSMVSQLYASIPRVDGFRGCIRNVLANAYYLDMRSPFLAARSDVGACPCSVTNSCDNRQIAVPWYTWLIVGLVLLLLITILTLVSLALLRRRYEQRALAGLYMDDTRDNIIDYKDTAGEQDHGAYNLSVLRKPAYVFADGSGILVDGRLSHVGAKGARRPSLCEFIDDKLNEQRLRPAYDTQLRFHDEGADLPSADLSSIDSSTPYDELDHRFLATLGPKFSLFTDIYIQQHESSSDS